ncbi:Hypothetical Protein FCC1311_038432 [Hondaea fermentalgiana]|uniref:Uncharacterized protein n=1 Tax=Hondaea fermentalgiana TaxID=2315210 RepID=A0A2R5G9B8_9STRA|nr:Hypothetical Protein FCC1311_038432 [Hondaea fermentalgiana]|eukprot:GBG27620.1 Hypothetical Protein FCC1311_038432 [Hondaea fermentalgiana]
MQPAGKNEGLLRGNRKVQCTSLQTSLYYMNHEVLFSVVYTAGGSTGFLVALCAGVIAANSVMGLFAALARHRGLLKVYLFASVLLGVFQFVCAILVAGARNPDQLRVQEFEIKRGWERVMDNVAAGGSDAADYFAFVSQIQNDGRCCGYDSIEDELQNPAAARCSFEDTCKEYLATYIIEEVTAVLRTYCVFVSLSLADTIMLFAFVVRVVPQPVHHEDPGGLYHA